MKKEIIEQISSELKRSKEFVHNSFPSVYTKQDVSHLFDEFADVLITYVSEHAEEKKSSPSISLEEVEKLSELLIKSINSKIERLDSEEVVDFSSASFSISYTNQVEIDSLDYNSDLITDIVQDEVDNILRDFFTPEEEVLETPYVNEISF